MIVAAGSFGERVAEFGHWRRQVGQEIQHYGRWLHDHGLGDPSLDARIGALVNRLREERMSVAFVAEFSRGKSELINALFFSGYGQRVLPSSAGRTTMCPTELMYDRERAPSICLLPIETRMRDVALAELRAQPEEWHEIAIDAASVDSVTAAFAAVRETRRATTEEARLIGLYDPDDNDSVVQPDAQGLVEIPRWRHAIVNIPDPLLEQGLVVIDTPGLNAIGSEPELTLNLIPSADAVLFLLAADAGVTRTDIDVWRDHVSATHRSGRFVVLNKIDGLWDALRSDEAIEAEIEGQIDSVARTLQLPRERVFALSAQKALVAKVQRDDELLRRSRLQGLEAALSEALVPQQREMVREHVERGFEELCSVSRSVLQGRRRALHEQLQELNSLRGKNRHVVDMMIGRIQGEQEEFEGSMRQLQGLRSVFMRHSQQIFDAISISQLKRHVRQARELMRASTFSLGLREGMSSIMKGAGEDLGRMSEMVEEISTMMTAMYRGFGAQYGFALGQPMVFSVQRYTQELERIQTLYETQFGPIRLVTTERWALMRRFFESVAMRIKSLYEVANRDVEVWLRAVMAPIEGQMREHQLQLRRRRESVLRVREASESLDARIADIEQGQAEVNAQIELNDAMMQRVLDALGPASGDQPAADPADASIEKPEGSRPARLESQADSDPYQGMAAIERSVQGPPASSPPSAQTSMSAA